MGNLNFEKIIYKELILRIKNYFKCSKMGTVKIKLILKNKEKEDDFHIKIDILKEYFPVALQENIIKLQKNGCFPLSIYIKINNENNLISKNNNELVYFQIKEYIITQITAISTSFVADRDMLTGFLNKDSILKQTNFLLNKNFKKSLSSDTLCFNNFEDNHDQNYYMLMIDIDDFKKFNSLYGYTVGDFVITSVSNTVYDFFNSLKKIYFSGRYGGEEFIILFQAKNKGEALDTSNQIKKNIKQNAISKLIEKIENFPSLKLLCNQIKKPITISGGLLKLKNELNTVPKKAEDLITKVSAALGVAKKTGKDKIIAFDDIISKFCFIAEVLPCEEQIRLNLGSWHGISPGMKFHVMDSFFNGKSAYFDSSGREKTGTRPKRIKATVEINSTAESTLEIQEKISFASIIKKSKWPLCPGDSLIPIEKVKQLLPTFSFNASSFNKLHNQSPDHINKIKNNATQSKKGSDQAFAVISLNIPTEMGVIGQKNIYKKLVLIIKESIKFPKKQLFKIDSLKNNFAISFHNFRWSCIKNIFKTFNSFLKSSVHENAFLKALVSINENGLQKPNLEMDMLCSIIQKGFIKNIFSIDLWDCRHANLAGAYYYKAGEPENAKRLFNEAINFDSEQWSPHNNLGIYFMSIDSFISAEKEYKKAIKLSNKKESYPLYNLAYLYLLKNSNVSKALKLLLKAKNLGLDDNHINNQIAMAMLENNKDPRDALKFSEKALIKSPDVPEFIDTKLMCLLKCDKKKEALDCAEKLIKSINFLKPFNKDYLEKIYTAVKNNDPTLQRLRKNFKQFDLFIKKEKI